MKKQKVIELGGGIKTGDEGTPDRMAIMLWGPPNDGKTTWAATAPGDKLWLSFGDREHAPVKHRSDVYPADVSHMGLDDLWAQAKSDNPFGLDKTLRDNQNIGTLVADSATALVWRALQYAVQQGIGKGANFIPTIEAPGQSAYGARNGLVITCLTGLLRVTAKHGVHFIVTAHEDDPTLVKGKEAAGIIDHIGVMLGGKIVNNVNIRLSEIWHLRVNPQGQRIVSIRPNSLRRPMKTRMFRGDQNPSFTLKYDAYKPDKGQQTIESFWEAWLAGKGKHLEVPK